jgi:hypothetical protein
VEGLACTASSGREDHHWRERKSLCVNLCMQDFENMNKKCGQKKVNSKRYQSKINSSKNQSDKWSWTRILWSVLGSNLRDSSTLEMTGDYAKYIHDKRIGLKHGKPDVNSCAYFALGTKNCGMCLPIFLYTPRNVNTMKVHVALGSP